MRILIATGLYPPQSGGPATYAALLNERLPARGFELRVLPFAEVSRVPKFLRHAAYFFKCLRAARGVAVIYALDTVSVGLPAALAAAVSGKKFLVRVPGDYAWEQGRQRFGVADELDAFQHKSYGLRVGLLRAAQNFVVKRAKKVIVPSAYMQKIAGGWGVKNAQVIYSSVEMPAVAAVERPAGFLVVSTGRRVPWKGFEALERTVAREPAWQLKICENMPRAQALGWVKAASVFVLNSTYEGLSHALVEAMMLGTPVVATRAGGNPELVEDGVNGLLIEPKNDEALHAALKKIETDPDAAARRAAAAKLRAQDFSIDKTIGQLCELLKTI